MKCPECERLGQRSKFYMPTSYFRTAMGGSQRYYDEDGNRHYHEVNVSSGQASCSLGHIFDVQCSTKCKAPGCEYGYEQTITLRRRMKYNPDAISAATRAMCRVLYGDDFDLHDHGSQDPDGRASLEQATEAAIEAYLEKVDI